MTTDDDARRTVADLVEAAKIAYVTTEGGLKRVRTALPPRPKLRGVDFWRGWPFPVAVAMLFVIAMLRAGATYALGRAAQTGARRTRIAKLMARPASPGCRTWSPAGARRW